MLTVNIQVQALPDWTLELPNGFEVRPLDLQTPLKYRHDQADATHEVHTIHPFYHIGYETGGWPTICLVLTKILLDPAVKTVWYGCVEGELLPVCTFDTLKEISEHYAHH